MTVNNTWFGTGRMVLAIAAGMVMGSVSEGTAQHWAKNAHEWFQLNDVQVVEGEPAVFTIHVPEKLAFAVRWRYQTEDASATAGSDYIGSQGTLQFNVGERVQRISVQTLTDDAVERFTEGFQLDLTDMETSTDGVTWERAGYIPRLPEYVATTGTIRDVNLPLDFLNPPDEPDADPEIPDETYEPQPDDKADYEPQPDDKADPEQSLSPDAGGGPAAVN